MRKVLFLLILCLVAALPSLAMADSNWTGAISAELINPANWNNGIPHNEYYTEIAGINVTDWITPLPATTPVIDSAVNVTWDTMQFYGLGATMTGGSVHLINYTSHLGLALGGMDWSTAWGLEGVWPQETIDTYLAVGDVPGTLTMTGGTFTVDKVGLGYEIWDPERAPTDPVAWEQYQTTGTRGAGHGFLTIAGDAVFTVEWNTFEPTLGTELWIHTGSYIDIRQDGELHVPVELTADVDAYIADGKIINSAGAALVTETIGGEYVVTCVPEPGTLLLLCLGLGSLALIRRK